ncbi:MAG: T9SS type A sorting domain-containing protein [Hymenobacteraceae bacterium]|nr:T9SS type A sorting domain-containing protein [Hymenobacteraceae bacterium]
MSFRFLPRRRLALLLLAAGPPLSAAHAQQRPTPTAWADDASARFAATNGTYASWLYRYRAVSLDVAALRPVLGAAPLEGSLAAARGVGAAVLALPLPDGTTGRFRLVEAPVMAPALAHKFPQIKTYAGVGLDDPTASVRCDLTPLGFHAQILSRTMGTIYVDPVSISDPTHYLSFYRHDMNRAARGGHGACGFVPPTTDRARSAGAPAHEAAGTPAALRPQVAAGNTLRSYRLALAATRENVIARGGTSVSALASMTTSVNRVVGVYEKELAVRMILVPNTDTLIATSTSTYANNDGFTMLSQNQRRVDRLIGTANYDIGHVFSTGGGGVADLGCVCRTGIKAEGVTGLDTPTGDAFDIDYVAHEMGHQFGANHPFNSENSSCGGGNRNPGTAYEPGSGSTIMAYAGICGSDDLQRNSDAYFHTGSYQEIQAEIAQTSCFTTQPTGNTPPTVTVPATGKTIPMRTPFRLTAVGADADGDALTYNWEDMDRGGTRGGPPLNATNQVINQRDPLFRSFTASASPTRYFPQLFKIISGASPAKGEALPTVTRALKFRCTVRDEHLSTPLGFVVGGVDYSLTIGIKVTATAGPFVVQAPNGPGGPQWYVDSPATVTWDVANTTAAPVSCDTVDIILSRDGGLTYTDTLAANVPNSGSATFTVPTTVLPTTSARVMVHAHDNFFFDISNASFSILEPQAPDYALSVTPTGNAVACPDAPVAFTVDVASISSYTTPVDLTVAGLPTGATGLFAATTVTPGSAGNTLTVTAPAGTTPGTYPLTVTGAAGPNVKTASVTLTIGAQLTAATTLVGPADAATAQALAPVFTWTPVPEARTYTLELSSDAIFTAPLLLTVPNLTVTTYALTGVTLTDATTYYWRVRGESVCGPGPASAVFSFSTADPTGLAPDALTDQLTVAPNPSSTGEFAVRLTKAPAGRVTLTVLDALGRTVQTAARTAGTAPLAHTVDLRAQPEGVYVLRLTLPDGRTAVRRLVKL